MWRLFGKQVRVKSGAGSIPVLSAIFKKGEVMKDFYMTKTVRSEIEKKINEIIRVEVDV